MGAKMEVGQGHSQTSEQDEASSGAEGASR